MIVLTSVRLGMENCKAYFYTFQSKFTVILIKKKKSPFETAQQQQIGVLFYL